MNDVVTLLFCYCWSHFLWQTIYLMSILLFDDLGTYCRCRCNRDKQMALSDNHAFHRGPFPGDKKNTNTVQGHKHHTFPAITFTGWLLNTLIRFERKNIFFPPFAEFSKYLLPICTCWLPRISGQFCDGSFSKSVINTKTALTRLSIQNNLFCRATFIIMAYYWIGTYKNSFWKNKFVL